MTVCPIAIVVGCRRCPAFKICPLKTVLGDAPSAPETQAEEKTAAKPRAGAKKK